jgi:hypothetical protein
MSADETKSLTTSVDSSKLDAQIIETANKILNEDNADATKDLVSLFNWNMSRKNVSRILKLNSLLDDVSDQMVVRFKERADQFSNSDLIDYMKTIQGAIDTSTKNLNQTDEPPVIVNQTNTQINVNMDTQFDREAKERILAAIQSTLQKANIVSEPVVTVEADTDTPTEDNQSESNRKDTN